MNAHYPDRNTSCGKLACGTVLTLSLLSAPLAANAVSYIVGGLGNFDAANYEGRDAYGFEVQIEGLQASDLAPSWTGNKFGNPVVVPYATGVYVRYQSAYDPVGHRFVSATVPKPPGTTFQGTCYMGYQSYYQAGCDHFGVHLNYTAMSKATSTSYRWMFEDPANPGQLVGSTNTVTVPTPTYYFMPAVVGQPPVLVAEVQLPPPPPPPVPPPVPQYGDATWVKVYKTEVGREVNLDELVEGNPIVPQTEAQIETNWNLMQPSPPPDGKRRQRGRLVNQGSPNSGSQAVIRRYETYAYTGAYDPITHEAVCGDGTCSAPLDGELGNLIAAQMAAVNIAVPSLTVAKVGSGNVTSADKLISCGSKCTSTYALGTAITLTAQAASNNTFAGWTGACTGAALTCNLSVNDAMNVTATFNAAPAGGGGGGATGGGTGVASPTLAVKVAGGKGSITSIPAGISCGKVCSTSLPAGTALTLAAIPDPGFIFVNWSGACSGTVPTCMVTGNTSLSVQANFSK